MSVDTIIIQPITVSENSISQHSDFILLQNYPNPFNSKTDILFSIAKDGFTTLKIYNILGIEISTLFIGRTNPGKLYRVEFDGTKLTSGIYFYRLKTISERVGDNILTGKMILIK